MFSHPNLLTAHGLDARASGRGFGRRAGALVLLIFVTALVASVALVVVLRPLCQRLGQVDHPGGRKRHALVTPLSGGFAIALAIAAVTIAFLPNRQTAAFVSGIAALLILGALDDRKHVPATVRLGFQFFAIAICMCGIGHISIADIGPLTGGETIELGHFAVPMTIFAGLAVMNAINMIDGLDGLCGGFSLIVLAVIAALSLESYAVNGVFLSATLGAICGFLIFNLRTPWRARASSFLGDGGSLVLGFAITWFTIQASEGDVAATDPITAVWLIGLPLADASYLIGTRLLRGASPLEADRFHLHHLFLRNGASRTQTLYAWLGLACLFMLAGLAMQYFAVPEWSRLIAAFVVLAIYCAIVNRLWRRLRRARSK